jgi:hypothetical protein
MAKNAPKNSLVFASRISFFALHSFFFSAAYFTGGLFCAIVFSGRIFMADIHNPYQSPQADVSAVRPAPSQGGISEKGIRYLRGASPWMRFMGIIGFIGCGLFVLLGIFAAVLPGIFLVMPGAVFPSEAYTGARIATLLMGLAYFAFAVLGFLPSRWLYKTGARLRDYVRMGAEADLEEAFRNTKAFWKFFGIITIIWLALVPVFIILTVLAALGLALM